MPESDGFIVRVAASLDDYARIVAVRSIVYMAEQGCPWDEEFDGNDHAATQVLGLLDNEPVATGRIRWFGGFAKLERLAVRPEARGRNCGRKLFEFMMEISRRKGFSRLYLHAQVDLAEFYRSYGFVSHGQPFIFSGYRYLEMTADFSEVSDALRLEDGPQVLNRPEGDWDRPGVLEAARILPAGQ